MMGETKLAICQCAAAQLGPGIFLDVRELPHLNMTAAESGGPSWPVPPNIVSPSCSAANILRLGGDGEMSRVDVSSRQRQTDNKDCCGGLKSLPRFSLIEPNGLRAHSNYIRHLIKCCGIQFHSVF